MNGLISERAMGTRAVEGNSSLLRLGGLDLEVERRGRGRPLLKRPSWPSLPVATS
jgi:hypothetical protein